MLADIFLYTPYILVSNCLIGCEKLLFALIGCILGSAGRTYEFECILKLVYGGGFILNGSNVGVCGDCELLPRVSELPGIWPICWRLLMLEGLRDALRVL